MKMKNDIPGKLIFLPASSFKPRLSRDGRTLFLFLNGNTVIALNLSYLEAMKANKRGAA